MSTYNATWEVIHQVIRETALDTAWAHWAALGSHAYAHSAGKVAQVVDPESLILLSLAYAEEEPRLQEAVTWWGTAGASLTSVNRLKGIVSDFGGRSQDYFATFAALAVEAGHRNWKRHAGHEMTLPGLYKARGPENPNLSGAAPLMLRMRAAFGASAKSDVLSYLISSRDATSSVAQISRAVGYTKTSVRDALKDIVGAGLVSESSGRPSQYSTNKKAWKELLKIDRSESESIPRWTFLIQIFAFLVRTGDLIQRAQASGMHEHVLASKARDIVSMFEYELNYHGMSVPAPSQYIGREYVEGFELLCTSLADWLSRDLYDSDHHSDDR